MADARQVTSSEYGLFICSIKKGFFTHGSESVVLLCNGHYSLRFIQMHDLVQHPFLCICLQFDSLQF